MSTYLMHRHKQGDTLDMTIAAQNADGTVKSMTGWSGISEVRESDGTLVETLTFTFLDAANGVFQIYSVNNPQGWPVAKLKWDIQFTTDAGKIFSSPTVTLDIQKDVSA